MKVENAHVKVMTMTKTDDDNMKIGVFWLTKNYVKASGTKSKAFVR